MNQLGRKAINDGLRESMHVGRLLGTKDLACANRAQDAQLLLIELVEIFLHFAVARLGSHAVQLLNYRLMRFGRHVLKRM